MFSRLISKRTIFINSSSIPKKLILVYSEQSDEVSTALAERIQRELGSVHLNAFKTEKMIESPQVPYTVIISKRTLFDGVLELQHYEPKIREEVHVSDLTERLLIQTGAETLRCMKNARVSSSDQSSCIGNSS